MTRNNAVLFRADANAQMGTGHVMRCLTLADALADRGWQATFACRELPDGLALLIRSHGHALHPLPLGTGEDANTSGLAHASWLHSSIGEDLEQIRQLLASMPIPPTWIVVDHYALDARWETPLRSPRTRMLVIDDLADRMHDCDVLLDQNLHAAPNVYRPLCPNAVLLLGSCHALLRPEFFASRSESLARRLCPSLHRLLISFGGTDFHRLSNRCAEILAKSPTPLFQTTILLPPMAPGFEDLLRQSKSWPGHLTLIPGCQEMGPLLTQADACLGAAGSSAWERACLGVPSALVICADNQRQIARSLARQGAALLLGEHTDLNADSLHRTLGQLAKTGRLIHLASRSSMLVDGRGVERVCAHLGDLR